MSLFGRVRIPASHPVIPVTSDPVSIMRTNWWVTEIKRRNFVVIIRFINRIRFTSEVFRVVGKRPRSHRANNTLDPRGHAGSAPPPLPRTSIYIILYFIISVTSHSSLAQYHQHTHQQQSATPSEVHRALRTLSWTGVFHWWVLPQVVHSICSILHIQYIHTPHNSPVTQHPTSAAGSGPELLTSGSTFDMAGLGIKGKSSKFKTNQCDDSEKKKCYGMNKCLFSGKLSSEQSCCSLFCLQISFNGQDSVKTLWFSLKLDITFSIAEPLQAPCTCNLIELIDSRVIICLTSPLHVHLSCEKEPFNNSITHFLLDQSNQISGVLQTTPACLHHPPGY